MGIRYSCVFAVINCGLMVSMQKKLILWTGERHCGKTTSAAKLAQRASDEGFDVGGLLAPCMYLGDKLVGFDALDLQSKNQVPLARSKDGKAGPFDFITDGLKLGNAALSSEDTKSADLIIVDEFGKLELKGNGWRKNVDSLLTTSDAVILLVVRRELVDAVRQLYAKFDCRELAATDVDSLDEVIAMLKSRCGHVEGQSVEA
jgi:nucleoside-triphosphatase THEP1